MAKRINGATTARSADGNGVVEVAPLTQPRNRPSLSGPSSPGPKKKKRSFWRWLWIWTQVALAIIIITACIVGWFVYQQGAIYYARAEKIDLGKLNDVSVTSTFRDVNGEELGRIFVEDRIVLKPEQIPDQMRKAVMAAEDRRFYGHGAIDYWGILRALRENFGKKGRVQGGSTIEQQLAKHLIGDFSRTLDRKFLEAFVAVRLEQHYSKDEILNYYMNRIYFGKGYFGVGAAARGYFGKEANQLSLPECAMLAGIIRAPTSSSPRVDIGKSKFRRDLTLRQMLDEGYITHEEYMRAVETPIHVLPAKPSGLQTFVMAAAVKEMEQILSIEGTEEMPQGLVVRTNIDLHLQHALEEQMEQHLTQIENAAATNSPAAVPAVNPTLVPPKRILQGSAIVADLATGRVMAWVGGRDFNRSQFDHISMARRENGALLQPIIYSLGFDKLSLSPASMINASYIDPTATASEADMALGNPATDLTKPFLAIQDALAIGNRAAATRVGLKLGPHPVSDWLRHAGADQARIPAEKPNVFDPEPMTLGDMAALYQVLGNDGLHRKLKIIQSITSQNGQVLYEDTKPDRDAKQDQLLDIVSDEQMTLTLQNALRTGFARTLVNDYGLRAPIAGMPGYSQGYRDAWFVGYTPKLLAGVWVGYDDSRPIGGKDIAVRSAVPLWGDVMRETLGRINGGTAFPAPAALSKMEIDETTGALRGVAGLAPGRGGIFVYLTKEQIDALNNSPQQAAVPHQWSDWLTTMFNDADETGLSPDQVGPGAQDKRSNIIPALAEYKMPGYRGDIVSADGTVYATLKNQQNLVVKWPAAGDSTTDNDILNWMRARFAEANKVIGVTVSATDLELLAQYHTQRYQPFTVVEDITPTQADQIRAAGLESKGFGFVGTPRRIYPRGPELAHVLGYLSRDQQRNKGKYLSGDIIYDRYKGASGLESQYNQDMVGTDGSFMISTTPDGYARSAAVSQVPTYGGTLKLAIDSKIQASAEKALNRKRMDAFVMMDVQTGNVVAMASHPTFDPNIFLPTIGTDEWQMLNVDQFNPLLNRAIDAQYPPGSCFKTVTSIAAMVAGVFDPNWVVHCTGYFDLDNSHRMNLKEEAGHNVSYNEALTHSFNTYFATLGAKVGRDVLLDTARSFNFGSVTGIDLHGELPGFIPDSESVRRIHQRDFGFGDTVLTAIGQGDVLVTPVQMVTFMASLANGGTIYRPRLVTEIDDHDGKKVRDIPTDVVRTVTLDSPFMADLKAAMINVIDSGTATVAHRDDFKIAAKTGTAQVGSKEKRRQIAWLCGYFPADAPKYSFAVMVQGEESDNHGNGLDDGLLGGREGGAIVSHILDDMYGPPPNAKRRSSEYEEYDKAPNLTSGPVAATKTDDSGDDGSVADATATDKTAAAGAQAGKKADVDEVNSDDSDDTGMGGGSPASARSSGETHNDPAARSSSKGR